MRRIITNTLSYASLLMLCLLSNTLAPAQVPRPEHPRPDFQRDNWLSLNGTWQFALLDEATDGPAAIVFDRTIVVPFPWQSRLSGVELIRDGVGWYQREITVLPDWRGQRVFLRFGAVDQEATVWLDGERIGEHRVAYIPFEFDITDHVRWGQPQTLTVRAVDFGSRDYPKGKQEGWYTPTGGIWQTVWLEARPATYIDHSRYTPDIEAGSAEFEIDLRSRDDLGSATVTIHSESNEFPPVTAKAELRNGKGTVRLNVRVPKPKLWHPDAPHLYPATIEAKTPDGSIDVVHTYFALREVSRGKWQDRPYEYVLLNGEPIYLRAALDQSFNPEGIYTAPSDEFLRRDMQITKRAGLNALRIHIKVDEPRRLYWADKLGVLLLADMPNMGSHPPRDGQRCNWENTWFGAIRRDFNHPAIIAWVLFNETWGIRHDAQWDAWIEKLVRRTKELDPTRLCEDNSPCRYDHVVTDINSWHFYINDYKHAREHIRRVVEQTRPGSGFNYVKGRQQGTEPLINSEYGGIAAGSGDADISWCLKYLTNELRLYPKICGYAYTELTDIEWEHNGIVNYDRSPKGFGYSDFCPGMTVADIFGADFICIDSEPCPRRKPGESLEVPLRFSHFSRKAVGLATLIWRLDAVDRFGWPKRKLAEGRFEFDTKHYDVVDLNPVTVPLPDKPMLATFWCRAQTLDGRVLARNYINIDVSDRLQPRIEVPNPRQLLLRWDPGLEQVSWPPPPSPPNVTALEKRWFEGDGAITYRIAWPDGIEPNKVESLWVAVELAARAGHQKYDWPGPKGNHNYPQTQQRKFPSDVEVLVAGQRIAYFTLPDDPADARGVLSHLHGFEPGSYGYRMSQVVKGDTLQAVLRTVGEGKPLELTFRVPPDAENRHGLAIFGDRLGRFPLDPTLTIRTSEPHGIDPDKAAAALHWVTALPTAPEERREWRYTNEQPPAEWTTPAFDDSAWQTGPAGFGQADTPGARVGTEWHSSDTWLRTSFDLPDEPVSNLALLKFHHDEDMTVYLNGERILERRGYVTRYQTELLPPQAVRLLRKGKNTLAVHCHQTGGGQYIDLGLTVLARTSP